jgi:pimeloyl-ACP methyl ester carboxylesterase
VFLHSGWGYEVYDFSRQIEALRDRYRILIPDRSGYGRSARVKSLPVDFHRLAAVETLRVLDALGIPRAALWGHSDGAAIAAWIGLEAPDRVAGMILEAFHFTGEKKGTTGFFSGLLAGTEQVGRRVSEAMERDHGPDWREALRMHLEAWLGIAKAGRADLYEGRLRELTAPALFLAGSDDPRSEPGDIPAIRKALPQSAVRIIEGAGHSPHSEPDFAAECARIGREFFDSLPLLPESPAS